jgi:hypothetical protein
MGTGVKMLRMLRTNPRRPNKMHFLRKQHPDVDEGILQTHVTWNGNEYVISENTLIEETLIFPGDTDGVIVDYEALPDAPAFDSTGDAYAWLTMNR